MDHRCGEWETLGKEGAGGAHRGRDVTEGWRSRCGTAVFCGWRQNVVVGRGGGRRLKHWYTEGK
jgi:hypothetical protein